jgi:hypothetical protein
MSASPLSFTTTLWYLDPILLAQLETDEAFYSDILTCAGDGVLHPFRHGLAFIFDEGL